MGHSPASLRIAAVVLAAESAVVLAATVLAAVDTAAGRSYQQSSGIALTVIGVACAVALALLASGLARARRWSRPAAVQYLQAWRCSSMSSPGTFGRGRCLSRCILSMCRRSCPRWSR